MLKFLETFLKKSPDKGPKNHYSLQSSEKTLKKIQDWSLEWFPIKKIHDGIPRWIAEKISGMMVESLEKYIWKSLEKPLTKLLKGSLGNLQEEISDKYVAKFPR